MFEKLNKELQATIEIKDKEISSLKSLEMKMVKCDRSQYILD
jgi:hypothetical protein